MPDFEILELALFNVVMRRNVRPMAKNLLKTFGSLNALRGASIERLREYGLQESVITTIFIMRELERRTMKERIIKKPILSHWEQIIDYCRAEMGQARKEQFRILFLNVKNLLIDEEVYKNGTIDQIAVFPREVIQSALNRNASAIVLVHNHPSGDLEPSRQDIEMTRQILQACATVKITVHDHIIIGSTGFLSFKDRGLL